MKVLLINGSPNRNGCTYTALSEVASTLEKEGIETEIIQVGNKDIRGCIGCRRCKTTGSYKIPINTKVSTTKVASSARENSQNPALLFPWEREACPSGTRWARRRAPTTGL